MSASTTIERLRTAGVVAVLRSADANAAVRTADALVAGGVTAIEITYTTPDAGRAIAELAGRGDPGVVVGAGTVTNREQAEEAVGAGAEFVVTPGTTESLAAAVTATGVASIMGALTPSEVMQVLAWGATAVKVFPGSIGGPPYLRALRGPFPDLVVMPTGGVGVDNLRSWFDAGAVCVGVGGELCPPAAIAAGEWDEIERRAASFAAALSEARV